MELSWTQWCDIPLSLHSKRVWSQVRWKAYLVIHFFIKDWHLIKKNSPFTGHIQLELFGSKINFFKQTLLIFSWNVLKKIYHILMISRSLTFLLFNWIFKEKIKKKRTFLLKSKNKPDFKKNSDKSSILMQLLMIF